MKRIKALLTIVATLLGVTIIAAPAASAADQGECKTESIASFNNTRVCLRVWYTPQTDTDGGANITQIRVGLHADDLGPDCSYMESPMINNDSLTIRSYATGSTRWSLSDFIVNGPSSPGASRWCERYFTFPNTVPVDQRPEVIFYYNLRVDNWPDHTDVIDMYLP